MNLKKDFVFVNTIGKGSYSNVKLYKHKKNDSVIAIKKIAPFCLDTEPSLCESAVREIDTYHAIKRHYKDCPLFPRLE